MDPENLTRAAATLPDRREAPGWSAGAVWPSRPAAPARTLVDVLDAAVRRHPLAPALDTEDQGVLDYRALRAAAGALAAALAGRGIGPGDRVGVRIPSGTAGLYLAVLGVLCSGAAYVPVDVDDPDERAEAIWADAGVCAVLGPDGGCLPGPAPAGGRSRPPVPADDAWVIFTSGTTGRPKGVAVSHRSAAAFVDAEAGLFLRDAPLGPGDRVLAGLSVAFDASCEEMWLAWRNGGCLVPAPRSLVKSGADLGPWLVERGITAVSTVPTLAALWPPGALDRVRLLIVGGEACPAELVDRLDVPGREFWNTYGPTETTVVACGAPLRAGQPVRIGRPLDGWELAVVGPDGEPVAWGEVGELVIGGVGAARYLDPAKDAEKFRRHPALPGARSYRSGDLVLADPEGLVYLGRADEQVKLGGRRVELGEIDAALAALPGVRSAAAAVRTAPAGGRLLVGYLVLDPAAASGPAALAALRARLAERLPAALVPVLAALPALPTRTSGKVDRQALPWPLPGADTAAPGAEPRGTAAWLAERWRELLGVPVAEDSDFFALGGTSLAAAQLVSLLRERHPGVSVADLYHRPRLGDLALHLDRSRPRRTDRTDPEPAAGRPRRVRPVPRRAGAYQAAVLAVLQLLRGLRWLLALAVADNLVGPLPWTRPSPWWLLAVGWLVLASPFGRAAIGAGGARLLTLGLRPGTHPRGGVTHLRLWTAERLAAAFSGAAVLGTPLAARYARMLGCTVGPDVHLHAMPPVTGLAEFGAGCSLEPEVDAAGWWLDGDLLRLGAVRVGPGARVGTRAVLMPGADVGAGADVAPGSCVTGRVPAGQRWHGSPARPDPAPAADPWPAPRHVRSRAWTAAYALSLPLLGGLPLLAALPALLVLYRLADGQRRYGVVVARLLAASAPLTLLTLLLYALLTAGLVRLLSRAVTPGLHPATGRAAWCAWAVLNLMSAARTVLFPLYAGLLTPAWLRLLGARVGRRVEASTVLGLPGLMRVDDYAFLADDTLLAPYEVRGGWLRLGRARVGRRSFVGNSGIVGPGRSLPADSLVGVLSDAPPTERGGAADGRGGSWLGRPGFPVRRIPEQVDAARSYDPPRRLVRARAAVELCRLLPVLLSVLLGDLAVAGAQRLLDRSGALWCVLGAGGLLLGCGVTACLLTTAAKWLLLGRYRVGRRPLWSSFVWRNELFDAWVEELAMPWLGAGLVGTPFLNLWLRSLGARIGRGVWCETHWLPELDLVRLGEGASVNRGVVVQTHLFHDRLLRMDRITVGAGATVGPHSIVLLGSELGEAAVVGPSSLVMRGESVPPRGRWLGNPVAAWPEPR
ncbi:Pls/PosA family non-ribosomal peptide synthetase [Streptacidiphilus sp. P02-A3a]|uniref:Pls/PosA family non-ribosomal peptide synthetase n=1 Tax=Streptacidiphilus sp. P02-A3a TaxID=2704468 RepID=UPI00351A3585